MNREQQLAELHGYYSERPIPENLSEIVEQQLDVSLKSKYLDISLKNPLLVAPGQVTLRVSQIKAIRESGYAGCVLKSVVGEAPSSACSMAAQRKNASYIRTVYEASDPDQARPIIHWDGRCDPRPLDSYLRFAKDCHGIQEPGKFAAIGSFLCHLPLPGAGFLEQEWTHTARALHALGYDHFEIDFCPFLAGDDYTQDQKNVLRWYRTCPKFIKDVSPRIRVSPKLLNLDWGLEFQLQMAEAAIEGHSDGLVVANRFYNKELGSAHGGEELRRRNLDQIAQIKKRFPDVPISATGGVYSGTHVYEYLRAGAENVQLLSYIMGKVNRPFAKSKGSKFEKVLHRILLDPEDGLVACMLGGDA